MKDLWTLCIKQRLVFESCNLLDHALQEIGMGKYQVLLASFHGDYSYFKSVGSICYCGFCTIRVSAYCNDVPWTGNTLAMVQRPSSCWQTASGQ